MHSTAWITAHDLSLVFDPQGRLWHFRSTSHSAPSIGAALEGTDMVITLATPGAGPGDLAVELGGRVLTITGEAGSVRGLVATVGLPKHVELHALETAYGGDAFVVRVPLAPATLEAPERQAVPVAC